MLDDGSYEGGLEKSYHIIRKRLYGRLPPKQVYIPPAPEPAKIEVIPYTIPDEPEFTFTMELPSDLIRKVVRETAARHGLEVGDIYGKKRSRHIVPARSEACYRLNKELGVSLTTIARKIGYNDHSSVFTAVHRHEAAIKRLETK